MSEAAHGDSAPVALVDLLDRLLAKGVVISGDIVISIADVDLVQVSLQALLSSVEEQHAGIRPTPWQAPDDT